MRQYEGYIENCTKDWTIVSKVGDYSLWRYFDGVEWSTGYGIKQGDVVKSLLEVVHEYEAKEIFNIVIECVED